MSKSEKKHKAKRDRSLIFTRLDKKNVEFNMHIIYFGKNMLQLRFMKVLKVMLNYVFLQKICTLHCKIL